MGNTADITYLSGVTGERYTNRALVLQHPPLASHKLSLSTVFDWSMLDATTNYSATYGVNP